MDPMSGHIVIVGAMGSGKTTLSEALAGELGRKVYDSDPSIEGRTGRSGREIAESEGVEALHVLEKDVLLEALDDREPAVIAAAASVIEDPEVRRALEGRFCVWVTADPAILSQRAATGSHRRDVGGSEHLDHRDPLFREVADLVVDTGALGVEDAVERVRAEMREAPHRP